MSARKSTGAAPAKSMSSEITSLSETLESDDKSDGGSSSVDQPEPTLVPETNVKPATPEVVDEPEAAMDSRPTTPTASLNISDRESTPTTPTLKEASPAKSDAAKLGEPKRILRSSPLPRSSPSTSDKKVAEPEPANSDGEEGGAGGSAQVVHGGLLAKKGQIRGRKPLKEVTKDTKENGSATAQKEKSPESVNSEIKENKDNESRERETSESKEPKDFKEITKELKTSLAKETRASVSPTSAASTTANTVCNRLTRKSAVQDLNASTRVTRNRQASGSRSDTPPVAAAASRGRRGGYRKMPVPMADTTSKRKRPDEDGAGSSEPGAKYIKLELKDDEEDAVSNDSVKVKHELMESDDVAPDTHTTAATSTATTTAAHSGRGRGRWGPRKQTVAPSTLLNSPTTRSTRQSKMNSPSPSPSASSTGSEAKRRRTTASALAGSTVTRSSSSTSLLKMNQHLDDDSKDSMTSSVDELLSEIKLEKITPDIEDEEYHMEEKSKPSVEGSVEEAALDKDKSATSEKEATKSPSKTPAAEGELLSVVINVPRDAPASKALEGSAESEATANDSSTSAASMDKAESLSPELVSEGVCEISVKQFYKKPEFLENNLGIEEDPKLGEIVQQASTAKSSDEDRTEDVETEDNRDDAVSVTSFKDGDVQVESTDKKEAEAAHEDDQSSNADNVITLLVDEDEDDDDSDDDENVLVVDETHLEDDEDDAATAEESENISMEYNASSEDVRGNTDLEAAEIPAEDNVKQITKNTTEHICDKEDLKNDGEAIRKLSEKMEAKLLDGETAPMPTAAACDVGPGTRLCLTRTKQTAAGHIKDNYEEEGRITAAKSGEVGKRLSSDVKIDAKLEPTVDKDNEKKASGKSARSLIKTKKGADVREAEEAECKSATLELEQKNESELMSKSEAEESPTKLGTLKALSHANVTKSPMAGLKEDDTQSTQSDTNSWVTLDLEYDEETLRQKEQHLQNLGLLTHKAAEQRRQEFMQSSAAAVEASNRQVPNKRNGKTAPAPEYTGTLKTVIKLNRAGNGAGGPCTSTNGSNRKNAAGTSKEAAVAAGSRRQSLKMTFQKGRARGQATDRAADNETHLEDSYYTIQNEQNEDSSHSEGQDVANAAATSGKNTEKEEILIPEKASSFKFHPGRLCQDQCFYCSGKFGLYDTPCHVGQIKSTERQQKILANEEKLTVDNCLCDACFRHVDRRANVPSYKKRLTGPGHLESASCSGDGAAEHMMDDLSDGHSTAAGEEPNARRCLVPDCLHPAAHSLRRKCIRKSVKKFLLNFDMPASGTYVSLCQAHYDAVIQCSGCVLCKRRLGKNHMYHITSDTDRLEKALSEMGIPVQLGIGTAVCKLCRYFANLLMKPPDSSKSQKAEFVKNYRKRLLQFHNIHDGSNEASEADDEEHNGATLSCEVASQKNAKATAHGKDAEFNAAAPSMELPSPTASTGSSVELINESLNAAAAPSNAANNNSSSTEMLLGNDVLVDYDVPTISSESNISSPSPPAATSNSQMSKLKAILQSSASSAAYDERADISNVLRSNPNISMRELFPGEEDLGLQFKAPFGCSSSQRTPEGWTRVQTFLQYDEPTRRLWEELQKPYGNQSSFLRHLILLEKYFRNGDLVLTPNASSNASVYTQTVRQRLTSYDKGHCGGVDTAAKPSRSSAKAAQQTNLCADVIAVDESNGEEEDTEAESLSKQLRKRSISVDKLAKQLNTNAVTITARPKDAKDVSASSSPQKSLLLGSSNSSSKEKEPTVVAASTLTSTAPNLAAAAAAAAAALASSSSSNSSVSSNSRSILKSNLLGLNNKSVEIVPISAAKQPATVAESKHQKILDVANKLLGNQLEAAAAGNSSDAATAATGTNNKNGSIVSLLTSPPELVSLQRHAANSAAPAAAQPNSTPPAAASTAAAATTAPAPASASLINTKRAHLLPKAAATNNRSVPPNVVILPDTLTPQERLQSKSWRPTLMPVEENQHLVNKAGPLYQTADGRRLPALVQVQSGGKPFLISIFDYNRMCILRREKLLRDQMLKATKNRREQQQQHHQQRHAANAAAAAVAAQANMQNAYSKQQQTAQQQLIHLQFLQMQKQQQKQQQQAALKSIGRFQPIAPKLNASSVNSAATTSTATAASSAAGGSNNGMQQPPNFGAPMMPLLASAINNAANATANPNSAAAAAAAAANASWLWNNFPDANQLLMNGAAASGGKALPHLMPKPGSASFNLAAASKQQQQNQLLLDNTLMSKIPKSLTVIPQHKLMAGNNVGGASGHTSKD